MIDINLCDLSNFFGCVQATNTPELKTNAFRPLRTYLQEKSFEKWSGNQLTYVGDHEDGKDFYDTNGVPYEMKGSLGLFNKNGSCKRVVLINKRPGQKKNNELKREDLKKTFEYMLLVDTKKMSIGVTTWDIVYSGAECDGAGATFKLLEGDYTMLAEAIEPSEKEITARELLNSLETIL